MKGNKKYTLEKFIEISRSVHGDAYDYSEVELVNVGTPVCIIDPEHGKFFQRPDQHMKGCGSPQRARAKNGQALRSTLERFVERAREIHGDLYDYSRSVYVNAVTKLEIIDPDHGSFWMSPNSHLLGQGNPTRGQATASAKRRIGVEKFIERAREAHGDLYDYSLVEYVNCDTKVRIIDPEHGIFEQTPYQHANLGSGHPLRPRRAETDLDHILPLSLVLCAKDRKLNNPFHRNRPLVKLLNSEVNLRPLPQRDNIQKYDYVYIHGLRVRASSVRNNYDIIAHLIIVNLGIEPSKIIEEDSRYIREFFRV